MRLAVFTSHFPGRVNTFFARDMRALLEAGIEIDIFPLYPLDPDLWRYVPAILDETILPRERVHHLDLVRTIGLAGVTRLGQVARFVRDSSAIRVSALRYGLHPLIKSEYTALKAWAWAQQHGDRFDHVLAYWGNYSATGAYVFHRLMKRRVPFSMFLHAGTDLYRDQVFLRQKLLHADNVFVVCEFNRRFIASLYPDLYPRIAERIQLYHLGLNLDEFPVRLAGRPARRVLAVGSLEKIKGFEHLVRAVARLAARGLEVDLVIIGEGPERGTLTALAERLGVASRVSLRGLQPFDRVREAMADATILVHPSTGLGDAVPTVIKEALAVGLPVVASHVAGIPELLDNGGCGVLVPPNDVDALAAAIEQLIGSTPQRRQLAEAGRRHAERQFDLWKNGAALAARLMASTPRDPRVAPVRAERAS